MEIFANWIFWVSLASIIFLFALIGYLSDSKRKKKESESPSVKPTDSILEAKTDVADNSDITEMPEPGSTLNLDNGTWGNSNSNETVSVDSFDNPFLASNTEEISGEQPASDLFDKQEDVITPVESYDFSQEGSTLEQSDLSGNSSELGNTDTQGSEELNVFEQPVEVNSEQVMEQSPLETVTEETQENNEPLSDELNPQESNELVQNVEVAENVSSEVSDSTITPALEESTNTDETNSDNTEIWKF